MSIAEQSAPATVEFYWRAGCGFCAAPSWLLDRLGVTLDKRDIWADESAAFVRSVANGSNETVLPSRWPRRHGEPERQGGAA
ncbi:MAG: hypothetical protein R2749_05470 [Acidimicrobiales bacterium]